MKPKPVSTSSASELKEEIETECRAGLRLIDSCVNSLAEAKFILTNVLEKSGLLFNLATTANTPPRPPQKTTTNNGQQKKSEGVEERNKKIEKKKGRDDIGKKRVRSRSRSRSPPPPRTTSSKRKSSSSSSSSSSSGSCSTCSGGSSRRKKKKILLLPSPRGAPLTKYKPPPPPPPKKEPKEKEKPLAPYSYYKSDNCPENYLESLPLSHVKQLNTKKLLHLRIGDCKKIAKPKPNKPSSSAGSVAESKKKKTTTSNVTGSQKSEKTVVIKPKNFWDDSDDEKKEELTNGKSLDSSTTKPSLSLFEDLLEKTKPSDSNRVKVGVVEEKKEKTKTDVEEKVDKEESKLKETKYKPGPKSKKDAKPPSPPPTPCDKEDSVDQPVDEPPPLVKTKPAKPRMGPKSRVKKEIKETEDDIPSEPLLPNSEEMRQKLLDTFKEFQKLTQPRPPSPPSPSPPAPPSPNIQQKLLANFKQFQQTNEILSGLKSIGEEDYSNEAVWKFGLDVNSRMARFFASTDAADSDSDSDSSHNKSDVKYDDLDVEEQHRGQFFLVAREDRLQLLRYSGSSLFTPISLTKLSAAELQEFQKSFIQ